MNNIFDVTLTEGQKKELEKAGFQGLANDGTEILFYLIHRIEYLKDHNKNYTKRQYEIIDDLHDIFTALYNGI